MSERLVSVGDAEICLETFGSPDDPTLLLIAGAAASMDWWDADLCRLLAAGGRRVVRYDHRDTGRSTTSPPGAPTYTAEELVTDPLALLDALGVASAQVAGLSMGGAIAYQLAVRRPDRVDGLVLMSTSGGGEGLPGLAPRLQETFEHPPADPDWSDRQAVVDHLLAGERAFAGRLGVDEEAVRRVAGGVFDRSHDPAAAANHWALEGGEDVTGRLGEIGCPTLVVHGEDDPFFPVEHGRALAAAVPGARLLVLPGMGHQVPPRSTWEVVVPEILGL